MKLNLKTAAGGHNNFTFSPMSLVSLDFGRVQPISVIETIAGGHYNANGNSLVRVAPQVFPPFGRCSIKHATFFVPFKSIYYAADSFLADMTYLNNAVNDVPRFMSYQLNLVFALAPEPFKLANQVGTTANPPQSPYDFVDPIGPSSYGYYKLTPRGEKAFALLKSLGYDFRNYNTATTAGSIGELRTKNAFYYNAMPLLAYLKVYYDFFMSGVYKNTSTLGKFLDCVFSGKAYEETFTIYNASTHELKAQTESASTTAVPYSFWLSLFRDTLGVPYESNLYNTAWNSPNSPLGDPAIKNINSSTGSIISMISQQSGTLFSTSGSNKNISSLETNHSSGGNPISFSSAGHRMLSAVDKFVRRFGLVGSDAYIKFMSQFGISSRDPRSSIKCSEGSQRMTFNAITSTADTDGASLGSFAGQGIGGMNISYNYECDDFGYLITVAWLSIDPIKMRGANPANLRIAPLDFYHADFDGKATRPLVNAELRGGVGADDLAVSDNVVFGYTGQYDDYRMIPDTVAGSFIGEDTRNFAFMRDFNKLHDQIKPQDLVVKQYKPTSFDDSLTNPFYTDSLNSDRFWFCTDWTIHASLPILSSEDSLDIDGSGSSVFTKNGDSAL